MTLNAIVSQFAQSRLYTRDELLRVNVCSIASPPQHGEILSQFGVPLLFRRLLSDSQNHGDRKNFVLDVAKEPLGKWAERQYLLGRPFERLQNGGKSRQGTVYFWQMEWPMDVVVQCELAYDIELARTAKLDEDHIQTPHFRLVLLTNCTVHLSKPLKMRFTRVLPGSVTNHPCADSGKPVSGIPPLGGHNRKPLAEYRYGRDRGTKNCRSHGHNDNIRVPYEVLSTFHATPCGFPVDEGILA